MPTLNDLSLFWAVTWYQLLTSAGHIYPIAQRDYSIVAYHLAAVFLNAIVSFLWLIHAAVLQAPSTSPSLPGLCLESFITLYCGLKSNPTVCFLFMVYLCSWGHNSRWNTVRRLLLWILCGTDISQNHASHLHSHHGCYKGPPRHLGRLKHKSKVVNQQTQWGQGGCFQITKETLNCHCASNQILRVMADILICQTPATSNFK